jgi:quinol monooxygenase YgiN
MYATIRRYRTDRGADATRSASRQFVHAVRQLPGFVAYYVVETGAGEWTSVTVFADRQAAERSDRLAAEFVVRDDAAALVGEPEVAGGEVTLHAP